MPRISDRAYLRTHKKLKRFWDHDNQVYAELDAHEQWDLHDYFQLSIGLTDAELLAHRTAITIARPSLPHQAGRALAKLDERAAVYALNRVRAERVASTPRGKSKRHPARSISIKSTVRPEIDVPKLAHAIMMIAKGKAQGR